jgi:hypothetical protein
MQQNGSTQSVCGSGSAAVHADMACRNFSACFIVRQAKGSSGWAAGVGPTVAGCCKRTVGVGNLHVISWQKLGMDVMWLPWY